MRAFHGKGHICHNSSPTCEEKLAQNVVAKAKLSGADVALYLAEAPLERL